MRIALSAIGSRGDVQPIIEIGTALARRGHEVRLVLPSLFAPIARERGLAVALYADDSEKVMQSFSEGWKALGEALGWIRRALDDQMAQLLEATKDADGVVSTVNEFAAQTVAEYRCIPHYRVAYAPHLPGDGAPPVQPFQGFPPWVNRLLWEGVNRGGKFVFGKALAAKRGELGLGPVDDFGVYCAGRSHNLLAINSTLGPPARGWHWDYQYVGYPFGGDAGPLGTELEEFLLAGPPPVYIGFGSVKVPDQDEGTRRVLRAVERVGCRAIVCQGWGGLGKGAVSSREVLVIPSAPHRTLFPRTAGVVHHGGSGTTHNAARAGVPQLLVPQIIDQYYWGKRIFELGLGPRAVPYASLTEDRLVRALHELLQPERAHQARAFARLLEGEDGAQGAALAIEAGGRQLHAVHPIARAAAARR